MNTVKSEWDRFEGLLLGKAGEVQRREMKLAFYSGAATLLSIALEIGDKAVDDNEGAKSLEALEREIRGFLTETLKAAR